MNGQMWRTRILVAVALSGVAGCTVMASQVWDNKQAGRDFVDGTRVLAELHFEFTRQEALAEDDGMLEGWTEKMNGINLSPADILNGSVVSVDTYCFAHNSSVGCKHIGAYVAYVRPELLGTLTAKHGGAEVNYRSVREHGDLLEVELRKTEKNGVAGIVVGIYRSHEDWQDCRYRDLQPSSVNAVSRLGPPVALWIHCDGAEHDGWTRMPVSGAPSHSNGSPVAELRKLPSRTK